ncbi:hypothetical protein HCN44_000295 [Aphidius gifuensis]|uniref:Uncharacterized protein n=2 Tax=Aphidius gifuensis TaxID=684658 RepID=A0A834XRM7_APHGI|nr:hypothetical protein HCN44_000295 [Aphidius gifuensis]
MDSSQNSLDTLNKAYSTSANLEDNQLLSDASINCQEVALSTEIPNEDTNTRCNTPVTHNTSLYNGSDDTTTDVNQQNYTDNQDFLDNNSLCKKRRRFEPLYTKEIELSDFSTPKRARRVIQMVKKENEKLSHKNKSLLRQNKYYKNKIKTYEDLISHLKKQHLMSKQMELSMVKYDSSSDQDQ